MNSKKCHGVPRSSKMFPVPLHPPWMARLTPCVFSSVQNSSFGSSFQNSCSATPSSIKELGNTRPGAPSVFIFNKIIQYHFHPPRMTRLKPRVDHSWQSLVSRSGFRTHVLPPRASSWNLQNSCPALCPPSSSTRCSG